MPKLIKLHLCQKPHKCQSNLNKILTSFPITKQIQNKQNGKNHASCVIMKYLSGILVYFDFDANSASFQVSLRLDSGITFKYYSITFKYAGMVYTKV